MTAAASLSPQSHTINGWWKRLAPFQPRALWAGELLVHYVDALVAVQDSAAATSLPWFALKALSMAAEESVDQGEAKLPIGRPVFHQILCRMQREGLAHVDVGATWRLTAAGRQVLAQGAYVQSRLERRVFTFVESELSGRPAYFNLSPASATAAQQVMESHPFDPEVLQACLTQPADWKEQRQFPLDVTDLLATRGLAKLPWQDVPLWKRVLVDHVARLPVILILTQPRQGSARLLGFTRRDGQPVPQAPEPAFTFEGDRHQVLPELDQDPAQEEWRQAWRLWCASNHLADAEVEACVLERQAHRLRVRAPTNLVNQLRGARNEIFRGEAWVVAGTRRLQAAANLELVAQLPAR